MKVQCDGQAKKTKQKPKRETAKSWRLKTENVKLERRRQNKKKSQQSVLLKNSILPNGKRSDRTEEIPKQTKKKYNISPNEMEWQNKR